MITAALLALPAAALLAAAGWLIERPERPKIRATGSHTRRYLRRAGRQRRVPAARVIAYAVTEPMRNAATIAWLRRLHDEPRTISPLRIAQARAVALAAVLSHAPGREPRPADPAAGWMTAPGPWDEGGRPVETAELPPPAAVTGPDRKLAELITDMHHALAGPPAPCPDWQPGLDDSGLMHLRYPWADQLTADFDGTAVTSR